jgi:nitrogen fixation NifU-like protein
MNELTELYQELLLDHSKRPPHYGSIDDPSRVATGHNPLCGDQITVYLKHEGDRLVTVCFTGQACAICTASASLMTNQLTNSTWDEADQLISRVHHMLTQEDGVVADTMGELGALAGVHRFPMRVKCATLPWHTVLAALRGEDQTSTE